MPLPDPKQHTMSLATFRRNGAEISTPVWYVVSGGKFWVYTHVSTWKTKRLRHNPRVRFAQCNASGKRILGDWNDGEALLHEDPQRVAWISREYKAKYTWRHFLIVEIIYRLTGRGGPGLAIEITPTA